MAIIGLQKGSGKRSRVREKSVKSQGILIWIMSGNPVNVCKNFNSKKSCTYQGCKFRHMCILPECNEAHSATVHSEGKN